jgi:hypothetical protein
MFIKLLSADIKREGIIMKQKNKIVFGMLAVALILGAVGCSEKAQKAVVEKGFIGWLQSPPPKPDDVVFSSDKKLSIIVIKNEAILDSNVSTVEIVETFEKIKEELNKKN